MARWRSEFISRASDVSVFVIQQLVTSRTANETNAALAPGKWLVSVWRTRTIYHFAIFLRLSVPDLPPSRIQPAWEYCVILSSATTAQSERTHVVINDTKTSSTQRHHVARNVSINFRPRSHTYIFHRCAVLLINDLPLTALRWLWSGERCNEVRLNLFGGWRRRLTRPTTNQSENWTLQINRTQYLCIHEYNSQANFIMHSWIIILADRY